MTPPELRVRGEAKTGEINSKSDIRILASRSWPSILPEAVFPGAGEIEAPFPTLRRNGFQVSDRGCFVYANGREDRDGLGDKLESTTQLIPYDGADDWVEEAVEYARDCLMDDAVPDAPEECEWCRCVQVAFGRSKEPQP